MKTRNKNLLIGGAIALASAAVSSIATYFIHNEYCYNTVYKYAADLYDQEKYEEAIVKFKEVEGYKNSEKYISLCREEIAKRDIEDLIDKGDYATARCDFDFMCSEGIISSNRTKDILHIKLEILRESLPAHDINTRNEYCCKILH